MFGFNWGEVIVIGIVALIAIGPKELPTVLRTLGQWMGKVRRMANEFQSQFNEALREAEFADLKKHADDLSSTVSNFGKMDPLADVQRDVQRALETSPAEAHAAGTSVAAAGVTAPAAAAGPSSLPPIDVPLPEPPPAAVPEELTPVSAKEPVKEGGGGA
jgi:sec-independent protein translocase protein TatB